MKRLCNFIRNPWEAGRIFNETISALKAKHISDKKIYLNRAYLLESMEEDIQKQIDNISEKNFYRQVKRRNSVF